VNSGDKQPTSHPKPPTTIRRNPRIILPLQVERQRSDTALGAGLLIPSVMPTEGLHFGRVSETFGQAMRRGRETRAERRARL